MSFLHSIILGIVEGITEFLPISSTAHLEITQALLKIPTSDFVKSFEIAIQLGAILAVVLLYFKKIFSSFIYFRNICAAFIPTGVIGFLLYKIIKSYLLGNLTIAAVALVVGGVIILIFESKQKQKAAVVSQKSIETLSLKELLSLGAIQALAVVPGVSRSGAVIVGGRMLGLSTALITDFSFLLAIPTMLAAVAYDLLKSGFAFSGSDWQVLGVGFIVSFFIALFAAKWLLAYIRNHTFEAFGWYRILVGAVALVFLIFS